MELLKHLALVESFKSRERCHGYIFNCRRKIIEDICTYRMTREGRHCYFEYVGTVGMPRGLCLLESIKPIQRILVFEVCNCFLKGKPHKIFKLEFFP